MSAYFDHQDEELTDMMDEQFRSRSKRIRHWHMCANCDTEYETHCEGRNSFGLWECECPSWCENCTEFERQKLKVVKQNLGVKKENHGH